MSKKQKALERDREASRQAMRSREANTNAGDDYLIADAAERARIIERNKAMLRDDPRALAQYVEVLDNTPKE